MFSDRVGALVTIGLIGLAFLGCGFYLGFVVFEFLEGNQFKLVRVIEALLLPVLAIGLIYGISGYWESDEPMMIYNYNRNSPVSDFVNPFLSYRMVDCSDLTAEYDIIFVPSHFSIETDILSYAPRRDRGGAAFGRDWYIDHTGSQWDRTLFNCVERGLSPN